MTTPENTRDVRRLIFTYRSYTPIPFLLVMIWFAQPTPLSMVVGFAIAFVGEIVRFWGVSIVGAETRTTGRVGGTSLITSGPFSYVRNPLYLGNMLLYAGVGVMSMALYPWLLVIAIVWFTIQYELIVTKEEEYLLERFGSEYEEYRLNVRRFIPRVIPYRPARPGAKGANPAEGMASERRTLQAILLVTAAIVAKYLWLQRGA